MKKIFLKKYSLGEVLLVAYAWIFARKLFVPFSKLLFHLSIRGLGVFNYQTFRISGERFLIRKLLPRLLDGTPAPVMFDVGANEGNFSIELMEQFPRAFLYSFEPHEQTFKRLAERIGERCRTFNFGLGDEAGLMKLYDTESHGEGTSHASLYAEVVADIHHRSISSTDVVVRKLDDVVEELAVDRIDFLKIDTEGNELSVLKGAQRLLFESRVGVIHFEFNEMNVVSRCFMRDFSNLLNEYRLFRLLPNALLEIGNTPTLSEIFGFQNIIAINKKHKFLNKCSF